MRSSRIILATSLLLASAVVTGQERFGGDNNTAQSNDSKNFCLYDGKKYSIGALIKVGDQTLECRMVPSTSELLDSGARWTPLYSGAGGE